MFARKVLFPFLAAGLMAPAVLASDAPGADELRVIPWREVIIPGGGGVSQVRTWVSDGDEHLAYSIGLDELVTAMESDPQFKGASPTALWRHAFCEGFWGIRANDDPQFPFWRERVKAPDFVIEAVRALPADKPSGRYVPLAEGGYHPYWRNLADLLGMAEHAGRVFFFPDTLKRARATQGMLQGDRLPLAQSIEYGSTRYCSYASFTDEAGKERSVSYLLEPWGTTLEHGGKIWHVAQSGDCTQLHPTPVQDVALPLLLEIKAFEPKGEGYELRLAMKNQGATAIEKPTEASRVILYFESADGCNVRIDETEYGFMESGGLKAGECMEFTLDYEPSDARVIRLAPGEPCRLRAVLVPNVSPSSPAYLRLTSPAIDFVPAE